MLTVLFMLARCSNLQVTILCFIFCLKSEKHQFETKFHLNVHILNVIPLLFGKLLELFNPIEANWCLHILGKHGYLTKKKQKPTTMCVRFSIILAAVSLTTTR